MCGLETPVWTGPPAKTPAARRPRPPPRRLRLLRGPRHTGRPRFLGARPASSVCVIARRPPPGSLRPPPVLQHKTFSFQVEASTSSAWLSQSNLQAQGCMGYLCVCMLMNVSQRASAPGYSRAVRSLIDSGLTSRSFALPISKNQSSKYSVLYVYK